MVLGEVTRTGRGFEMVEFEDCYGVKCTLQASSLAIYEEPGTSAVWLGPDHANPRILVPGKSWQPVTMPDGYLADTRAHLTDEQVRTLIAHLQAWLDTGSFVLTPLEQRTEP